MNELGSTLARLTFRNVRGNGDCRSAHLCNQPQLLFRWKGIGNGVYDLRQKHPLLPDLQISVACNPGLCRSLHHVPTPATPARTRHPSLITALFIPTTPRSVFP